MPTVYAQSHWPNKTPVRSLTTASTSWRIIASDGTPYADYATLLAAGKVAWPGSPADFPQGVPAMFLRTTGADGKSDGSPAGYKTNVLIAPATIHDVDDMISGSGQTIIATGGIKSLWIQQSVAGDYTIVTGLY